MSSLRCCTSTSVWHEWLQVHGDRKSVACEAAGPPMCGMCTYGAAQYAPAATCGCAMAMGFCPDRQLLHMSHEWHWVFHRPCAAAWLIGYCSSCCCLPVGWAVHLPIVWWVVPIMVEKFVLEAQGVLAPLV